MNEKEARQQILALAADYCDKYKTPKNDFKEGDRIPYASRVFDHSEMVNLIDSALEFWLTSGRYTEKFESEFAKFKNYQNNPLAHSENPKIL